MLTINPSKRITAAEALKHPWISVSLPQQDPSQDPPDLRVEAFTESCPCPWGEGLYPRDTDPAVGLRGKCKWEVGIRTGVLLALNI